MRILVDHIIKNLKNHYPNVLVEYCYDEDDDEYFIFIEEDFLNTAEGDKFLNDSDDLLDEVGVTNVFICSQTKENFSLNQQEEIFIDQYDINAMESSLLLDEEKNTDAVRIADAVCNAVHLMDMPNYNSTVDSISWGDSLTTVVMPNYNSTANFNFSRTEKGVYAA